MSEETKNPPPKPQLKVGAHVLIQLGRELVTDAEQAILECVKNAYDADAPGCNIEVSTRETGTHSEIRPATELEGFDAPAEGVTASVVPTATPKGEKGPWCRRDLNYVGRLTITDAGDGMTPAQLEESWLVVSGSAKRGKHGEPKPKTKGRNRTPLGDKGLGRLGTMKLGDILLVETATAENSPIARARFRWADCERAVTVDKIPVFFDSVPNSNKFKGTKVTVLGLNDLSEWRRENRLDDITVSLAKLVSPFEATSKFPVAIHLDGKDRSLLAVTDEVLSRAVAQFEFRWERDTDGGMVLVGTTKLRKSLLAPTRSAANRKKTDAVFGKDGGAGFRNYLLSPNRMKGYSRREVSDHGPWYVELERRFRWSDMLFDNQVSISDPGPFNGTFYYFHFSQKEEPAGDALLGKTVTSNLVKGMTGIAILRDGFQVRSQGDWLNLSQEMTSGSTYGLRADNTVGYFALTGEFNPNLTEKSDREGFVEDATYRGFVRIARKAKDFATDSMQYVRRLVDEYAREIEDQTGGDLVTPGASLKSVERSIQSARTAKSLADSTAENMQREIAALEREVIDSGDVARTAKRAVELAKSAGAAMDKVRSTLVADEGAVGFLSRELNDRKEQATALFESAAVGLSARGLAHELRTHLTEIRTRSSAIQAAVGKGGDTAVLSHLRAIRGSCTAISNAASLIDPMLPRSRTIKETFAIADFIREYAENRAISFEHAGIKLWLEATSEAVTVRTNRPRMLQVLDNLVRNSAYWLKRGSIIGQGETNKEIHIVVDGRGFVLWDNGPGVSEHVEEDLFKMFVTGREDPGDGSGPTGQGIGLYIVEQLLALEGCTIALLPERNRHGRRHRFDVDLSPVIATPALSPPSAAR